MDDNKVGLSNIHKSLSTMGRNLDKQRSRDEYRYELNDARNPKIQKIREYAYTLVQSYTIDEKMQLIATYGDAHMLGNNPSTKQINEQLVETLIINLPQGELQEIMNQAKLKQNRLVSEVKRLNKMSYTKNTINLFKNTQYNQFNYGGDNSGASGGATDNRLLESVNSKNLDLLKLGPSGKRIEKVLIREMKELLDNTTPLEIKQIAVKLKLDVTKDTKTKDVRNMIINKCAAYVWYMTDTNVDSVPLVDPAIIKEIERLVGSTSFSYVTGNATLTNKDLSLKKKEVLKAKRIREQRMKLLSSDKGNRSVNTKSAEFAQLTGKSGKAKSMGAELENNDTGFLKNYTLDELFDKANELGIDYNPNKITIGKLKMMIYQTYGKLLKDKKNLNRQLGKAKAKGMLGTTSKIQGQLDAINSIESSKSLSGSNPNALPRVIIDSAGNAVKMDFTDPIAVWVVGQGYASKGTEVQDTKSTIEKLAEMGLSSSGNDKRDLKILNKFSNKLTKQISKDVSKNERIKVKTIKDLETNFKKLQLSLGKDPVSLRNARLDYEEKLRTIDKIDINQLSKNYNDSISGLNISLSKDTKDRGKLFKKEDVAKDEDILVKQDAMNVRVINFDELTGGVLGRGTGTEDFSYLKKDNEFKIPRRKKTRGMDANKSKGKEDYKSKASIRTYMNQAAQRLIPRVNFDPASPIAPVFITNGFTEFLNNTIEKGFEDMVAVTGAIGSYLNTSLPVLFAGLQNVGMTVNAASASSFAALATGMASDAIDTALRFAFEGGSTNKVQRYATGGFGSAVDNQISQFITGDSLNGKPNEELVTVDWKNKKFNVKPTNNESSVATSSPLSKSQRTTPMNISFANSLIKYNRELDGETNDNLALKVYPVTPGINDKIDIGDGKSVSVMDLLLGINSSLVSLNSLMAANVEVNKIVAAKPVASNNSSLSSVGGGFPNNLNSILRGA